MSLRLISDGSVTAMYDSVSGWAFGPTFDSESAAESFLRWCEEQGVEGGDVRAVSLDQLSGLEARYYRERREAGEDV